MKKHKLNLVALVLVSLFLNCGCHWLEKGLSISVVDGFGGPGIVGAEIFYIDQTKSYNFEFEAGELLGVTNENGFFHLDDYKKLGKDKFSLLVKKTGYGNSLVQNYFFESSREHLEIIMSKFDGISEGGSTIYFDQLLLSSEEEGNSSEVELLNSPQIQNIDDLSLISATAKSAYPIVVSRNVATPIMMGLYNRPSGLGLLNPQNANYELEKSQDGLYRSSGFFSFLYAVKESKVGNLYFVAYDIMGNRVELPLKVNFESLEQSKGVLAVPKITSVEMRTFGQNRNISFIDFANSRDTTGYAVLYIDGKVDSKNLANWSSFEIYLALSKENKYEKVLTYPILNQADKYEVVVSSLYLQPTNSYKFKVRAFNGNKATAFSYSSDVGMLAAHQLKIVGPDPTMALNADNVELAFDVVGLEAIKAFTECRYIFTLNVESIDSQLKLGVKRKSNGITTFDGVTIMLLFSKDKSRFYINDFAGDSLIELTSCSYNSERITINLSKLLIELEGNFSLESTSGGKKFSLNSGTSYTWDLSYQHHGAMVEAIFDTDEKGVTSKGLSFASSNESDGIAPNGSSYFSIKE